MSIETMADHRQGVVMRDIDFERLALQVVSCLAVGLQSFPRKLKQYANPQLVQFGSDAAAQGPNENETHSGRMAGDHKLKIGFIDDDKPVTMTVKLPAAVHMQNRSNGRVARQISRACSLLRCWRDLWQWIGCSEGRADKSKMTKDSVV
jgi:hypothetical protein